MNINYLLKNKLMIGVQIKQNLNKLETKEYWKTKHFSFWSVFFKEQWTWRSLLILYFHDKKNKRTYTQQN